MIRMLTMALLLRAMPTLAAPPPTTVSLHYNAVAIEFGEPMQIWANESRDDVVTLKPALPTQCSWDSDTRFFCKFKGGARPARATRYHVLIAAGLKTQTGVTTPATTLQFETERPRSPRWWKAERRKPQIVVSSHARTSVQSISSVLRLSLDGSTMAAPDTAAPPARGKWDIEARYEIQLAPSKAPTVLTLSVVPGLISTEGPLPGIQEPICSASCQ